MGKLTIRGEAAKEYAYDLMEISVQFWGNRGLCGCCYKESDASVGRISRGVGTRWR